MLVSRSRERSRVTHLRLSQPRVELLFELRHRRGFFFRANLFALLELRLLVRFVLLKLVRVL